MNIEAIVKYLESCTEEELAVLSVIALMVVVCVIWPFIKKICKALIVYDLINGSKK